MIKIQKRLFICKYYGEDWVCGIIARDHQHAKKLFYDEWNHTHNDPWCAWIDIRVKLFHTELKIDLTNRPYGEIDSEWGYEIGLYYGDEY